MKILIAGDDTDLGYGLQVFFQRNNINADTVVILY